MTNIADTSFTGLIIRIVIVYAIFILPFIIIAWRTSPDRKRRAQNRERSRHAVKHFDY